MSDELNVDLSGFDGSAGLENGEEVIAIVRKAANKVSDAGNAMIVLTLDVVAGEHGKPTRGVGTTIWHYQVYATNAAAVQAKNKRMSDEDAAVVAATRTRGWKADLARLLTLILGETPRALDKETLDGLSGHAVAIKVVIEDNKKYGPTPRVEKWLRAVPADELLSYVADTGDTFGGGEFEAEDIL